MVTKAVCCAYHVPTSGAHGLKPQLCSFALMRLRQMQQSPRQLVFSRLFISQEAILFHFTSPLPCSFGSGGHASVHWLKTPCTLSRHPDARTHDHPLAYEHNRQDRVFRPAFFCGFLPPLLPVPAFAGRARKLSAPVLGRRIAKLLGGAMRGSRGVDVKREYGRLIEFEGYRRRQAVVL